ncbi:hypothetical protein GJU93_16235 [Brucella sp. 10RB9212]|uniref:hypothetical protein n=1 Tax=unclassified Brucella TaxID=2632610 RepID=UPI00097287EF|nr:MULTISPECIES: hypothetical protein [unclassified Brucella]APY14198.1 hypothetical protein BKD02_07875 [Brucella sp. 09RB8910]APY15613.1 hypothetical protein BKD02_15075 [Brucella sp. 09RB8910]MRN48112.1 hypothetical protein [Brucella sp. 10RB9212]
MRYALISQGSVIDVVELDDVIDPLDVFAVELAPTPCDEDVESGWLYDGEEFALPVEPEPQPELVPDEISRRQFFQQLAVLEIITRQEALDALDGAIPAPLQAIIDQLPTDDDKFNAQMLVKGAQNFNRTNPLAEIVRQAMQWTIEQKDNFWRQAAKL